MRDIDLVSKYLQELWSLTGEMAPYLLLGFLIGGILHVYIPRGAFEKWFGGRNFKSVLYASLMGIPLPLCSCGVIPTGISIYRDGALKRATLSFLISTPQTGVDSIMVTYSLLGLPFALMRPVIALVTGVFGGLASNMVDRSPDTYGKSILSPSGEKQVKNNSPVRSILNYAFGEFLDDIADWLVIGLLLAGVIAVLIPENFFESVYLSNELLTMLIILAASVPFYVCATGSVPIAAILLMKGLNPGAVLVFLMAGPATNVATMTVISKTMGNKTLAVYLSSIVVGSMVFGLAINHLFPPNFFKAGILAAKQGHHEFNWLVNIASVLFLLLLTRIYLLRLLSIYRRWVGVSKSSEEAIKIEIAGMTCQNCQTRVENSLMQLEQVNESSANIEDNTVEIKGNHLDLDSIKKAVEGIGYHFKKVLPDEN